MKTIQTLRLATAGAVLGLFAPLAQSASVYLSVDSLTIGVSEGTATLEMFMDFTGTPTLGGGVDVIISGPASYADFIPSAWLQTDADPFFSGVNLFALNSPASSVMVAFGSFVGLSGLNKVGDLVLNLNGVGQVSINLAINNASVSPIENFIGLALNELPVALNPGFEDGITLQVVPVPAAVWLFLSGLGVLGVYRRRALAA